MCVDLSGVRPFASNSFNSAFSLRHWALTKPVSCSVSLGKEAVAGNQVRDLYKYFDLVSFLLLFQTGSAGTVCLA